MSNATSIATVVIPRVALKAAVSRMSVKKDKLSLALHRVVPANNFVLAGFGGRVIISRLPRSVELEKMKIVIK
jgi:hypothetical protein